MTWQAIWQRRIFLAGGMLALVVAALLVAPQPTLAQQAALGSPANLEVTSKVAGQATLTWTPAANADFHWIYSVKADRSGGKWTGAGGTDSAATVVELEPGQRYWFIIIAKRDTSSGTEWSLWSGWQSATVSDGTAAQPAPAASDDDACAGVLPAPGPAPTGGVAGDYDQDDDGLIEVDSLARLNAMRWDSRGVGVSTEPDYARAFPRPIANMGCPDSGCTGYELVADLDFDTNGNGQADAGDAYWNDGDGWSPIGLYASAIFDGGGHTIANLYGNHGGLFSSGGTIKNVGLVSVKVSGHGHRGHIGGLSNSGSTISNSYATGSVSSEGHEAHAGGLVGNNYLGDISNSCAAVSVSSESGDAGGLVGNDGDISASYATGNVSSESGSAGGLVGYNRRDISASYATGDVSSEGYGAGAGGLVGDNDGDITASYATGNVSSESGSAGGLVGANSGWGDDGDITASYATGDVSSESGSAGGLVGDNRRVISASYATGNVSTGGEGYAGGLVADNSGGTITASYATGSVSTGGEGYAGGLVADNSRGTITASYAVGRVSTTGETLFVGGLVGGVAAGAVADSYWDTSVSGQTYSIGDTPGKTTGELQGPTGYTGIYANWNVDLDNADRDGDTVTGGDDPWDFGSSNQYPVLKYGGLSVAAQRR